MKTKLMARDKVEKVRSPRRKATKQLAAIIEREGDGFVSLCPQLDIASQGDTIEEAKKNLEEALDLFFECASSEEIGRRMSGEIYLTVVEIAV